ncbi:hypothetical protein AGMMS49944_14300 [Spirochaetia bacterium]|nr:hypothetical protein AGMMS49944_14300 [Spirochaetia bacterium]
MVKKGGGFYVILIAAFIASILFGTCANGLMGGILGDKSGGDTTGGKEPGGTNPQVGRFFLDSDLKPTTAVTDTTAFAYEDSAQKVLVTSSDKAVGSSVNFILPDSNIGVQINFAQDNPFPYGFSIVQDGELVAVADLSPFNYETQRFSMTIHDGEESQTFEELIFNKNVLNAYQDDPGISPSENIRNRNLFTAMVLWSAIDKQLPDNGIEQARWGWSLFKNVVKAVVHVAAEVTKFVAKEVFSTDIGPYVDAFVLGVDIGVDIISIGVDVSVGLVTGEFVNVGLDTIGLLFKIDEAVQMTNPPDAPQNVNVIAQSSNSVQITWSPSAKATHYYIHRDSSKIMEVTSTTYIDRGVSPDTTYYYWVIAASNFYGKSGSSAYSVTTPALPATPTANPAAGAVPSGTAITLSTTTAVATIYYTTDGTSPTTASTQYTAPIPISIATTIKAIAVKSSMGNSSVLTAAYTILQPVATPTASPAAGAVISGTAITLSTTTAGATIYYTTDGTGPTTVSTPYSTPITVSTAQTIKAIAVKSGMGNSSVFQADYTIIPTGTAKVIYTWVNENAQIVTSAVSTTLSRGANENLTINVTGSGYSDYQWSYNGSVVTGANTGSYTFNSAGKTNGIYNIGLQVKKDNAWYSTLVTITVTN